METRTLITLDARKDGCCEHCLLDRLKRAFDDRYLTTAGEYELLIVTPEQERCMLRLAWPDFDSPRPENIESWWGVPVVVQD